MEILGIPVVYILLFVSLLIFLWCKRSEEPVDLEAEEYISDAMDSTFIVWDSEDTGLYSDDELDLLKRARNLTHRRVDAARRRKKK